MFIDIAREYALTWKSCIFVSGNVRGELEDVGELETVCCQEGVLPAGRYGGYGASGVRKAYTRRGGDGARVAPPPPLHTNTHTFGFFS